MQKTDDLNFHCFQKSVNMPRLLGLIKILKCFLFSSPEPKAHG